jgi:hypothetical protein
MPILLLILLTACLAITLSKNYQKGLCLGAAFIVALPEQIATPSFGGLPNFTIQRVLIATLLIFWFRQPTRQAFPFGIKLAFGGIAAAYTLSLLFSTLPGSSVKAFLSFIIEELAVCLIFATGLRTRDELTRLLRSLTIALVVVAACVFLERYREINVVNLVLSIEIRPEETDILGTFRHRMDACHVQHASDRTDGTGFPDWFVRGTCSRELFLNESRTLDGPFWCAHHSRGSCQAHPKAHHYYSDRLRRPGGATAWGSRHGEQLDVQ